MNGAHDMGGQHGFGAVVPESAEPLFHAEWERRALGLTLAMGATGQWNIDMSRAARERIGPALYLRSSYYQIWLEGLQSLLLDQGLVSPQELATGQLQGPAQPVARVLQADAVAAVLARGAPTERQAAAPARFRVGQRVRTRNHQPSGHTRLPGYARCRNGTVVLVHGCHVFADTHARRPEGWRSGLPFDESPTWLYTVAFTGRELWGPHGEAEVLTSIDAWEPYLEAVEPGELSSARPGREASAAATDTATRNTAP
jgi:nitrile hydratase subunit beta